MTAPADLRRRIAALIDRLADGARDDPARDRLLVELARHQLDHIAPWHRLAQARGLDPASIDDVGAVPALPTDVFRFARVAVHGPAEDRRVFRTSGTTGDRRGAHPLADLSFYDRACRAAARHALFPDVDRMRLIALAPNERIAPDSSLSYMLTRFGEWFGQGETEWAWRDGRLDPDALRRALAAAIEAQVPVALLGTSFAFVHAEDHFGTRVPFPLPAGSRLMHTGGFKGRSREVAPDDLRSLLVARYSLPDHRVVVEYGMTELSSQMYERSLREAFEGCPPAGRALWVPGWVRATPVDPETLAPVSAGEVGILRIDDLANVDTPCCIQTADLARQTSSGLVVLGRAAGAVPRGCSLAVDEALGGGA